MWFEISLLGKTLERQTNKSTQKEKNTEVKRCTQINLTKDMLNFKEKCQIKKS